MASEWDSFWAGLKERLLLIAGQVMLLLLVVALAYIAANT